MRVLFRLLNPKQIHSHLSLRPYHLFKGLDIRVCLRNAYFYIYCACIMVIFKSKRVFMHYQETSNEESIIFLKSNYF